MHILTQTLFFPRIPFRIVVQVCLLTLVLDTMGCSSERWLPPFDKALPSCNPTSNLDKKGDNWKATFGDKGDAMGCLQMAWGDKFSKTQVIPILLRSSGQLLGWNDITKSYFASPSLQLNENPQGSRRIRIFVFTAAVHKQLYGQKDTMEAQKACTPVAGAGFDCATHPKQCWFTIEMLFSQKQGETAPNKALTPPKTCTLDLPITRCKSHKNYQKPCKVEGIGTPLQQRDLGMSGCPAGLYPRKSRYHRIML